MKTVTLKSGSTLEVQQAGFLDGWFLTQAVSEELAKALPGLKMENAQAKVEELLNQDIDVGKLLSIILQLVSSKKVFELLWPCLAPCLYNSEKIARETFNEEKAREDFLPCVIEILKVNVVPFIKGLSLSSMTGQARKSGSQK